MLYIFCAMRCEAQPIIDKYSLKLQEGLYVGEKITLCITGMGKVNMAFAVGKCSSVILPGDRVLNIGVCAGKTSGIYEIVKVTDNDTSRDLYPDIIMESGIKKAELITVSKVINNGDIGDSLYDMEGSAFAESCFKFTAPHSIGMIKIVSDDGHGVEVTNETVDILMNSYMNSIAHCIDCNLSVTFDKGIVVDDDGLSKDLKCSEYMYQELRVLLKYAVLNNIDYKGFLEAFYREDKLPATSKKEGKEILDALREYIIG